MILSLHSINMAWFFSCWTTLAFLGEISLGFAAVNNPCLPRRNLTWSCCSGQAAPCDQHAQRADVEGPSVKEAALGCSPPPSAQRRGRKQWATHPAPDHLSQPASWAVWHQSWKGKIGPASVGEKETSADSHHKGQTALRKRCPQPTLAVRNPINMLKIRREHKWIVCYLQEKTKSICILFKFWFIALKWFPKAWS